MRVTSKTDSKLTGHGVTTVQSWMKVHSIVADVSDLVTPSNSVFSCLLFAVCVSYMMCLDAWTYTLFNLTVWGLQWWQLVCPTCTSMPRLRAVQVKDPSENCWGWFNPPPGAEPLPKKQACGDYQLFDLSKDPYEKNDLSGKKTSKVNELKELWVRYDVTWELAWNCIEPPPPPPTSDEVTSLKTDWTVRRMTGGRWRS